MSLYTISLAAPAYNEAKGLEDILKLWLGYLASSDYLFDYEIVICNDGSIDQTGEILDRLAKNDPHLRPVHLPQNQGAAVALSKAIKATSMDWVLLIDSDGQFPISHLDDMLEAVLGGAQAVVGIRNLKRGSIFSRFGSTTSGAICNLIFKTHYSDFNSAFKLVPGKVIRRLPLEARGLNYSTDITAKLLECGVVLTEVPIEHLPRIAGKSNMRVVIDAFHRFLFVAYIGYRQFLFKHKVLQPPEL